MKKIFSAFWRREFSSLELAKSWQLQRAVVMDAGGLKIRHNRTGKLSVTFLQKGGAKRTLLRRGEC